MKLNLQLFALNTQTSIVDYLKSKGQDSSYSARKKLAQQYGITNYSGSEEQNIKLLNAVKSGTKTSGTTSSKPTTTTPTTTTTVTTPTQKSAIQGVSDQTYTDMTKGFQMSSGAMDAQNKANEHKDNYIDAANTPHKDEAYDKAMSILNAQKEQLQSGRTKYTDQVEALMSQITNREKFSYDMDSDTMFQQYLSSMMRQGASAMADTMGQASMLTGGYGSSYATSAANQAYNAYIENAYANLPDYYNMAMNAYKMEGEELYNQFSMYSDADAKEYQKMLNAYDVGWQEAQHLYDKGWKEREDKLANLYNIYQTSQSDADRLYKNEWDAYMNEINQANNMAQLEQGDYWNQKDYDFKVDQAADEYDRWLAQNDFNGDGVVNTEDQEYQLQLENQYNGYIDPDDVEVDENGNIIKIDGYNIAGSDDSKKVNPTVSGFKTKEGDNFDIYVGDKKYRVENKGKVTSQATLDSIKAGTAYGNVIIAKNGKGYYYDGKNYYRIGDTNGLFNIGVSKNSGYGKLLQALQK